jgi:hypothetical protein
MARDAPGGFVDFDPWMSGRSLAAQKYQIYYRKLFGQY